LTRSTQMDRYQSTISAPVAAHTSSRDLMYLWRLRSSRSPKAAKQKVGGCESRRPLYFSRQTVTNCLLVFLADSGLYVEPSIAATLGT
jgi:hypothetical protein